MGERPAPEEFEKLTLLMKEYTEKLRAICEERLDSRFRQFQSTTIVTIAAAVGAALVLAQRSSISSESQWVTVWFAALAIPLTFVFFLKTNRFRYSYDAERVAATVERLIRLASQYNEHAQKKISDGFELELRIAEAEGALSLYRKVFTADPEWKAKG